MRVVLLAVISLDGRLTRPGESGPGFASAADQRWFRQVLRGFDCSIMGRTTYEAIAPGGPEATGRTRVVLTHSPPPGPPAGGVAFTHASPGEIVADLRARGHADCALLGGGQVYAQFLDAGLVDAMWLTLEPVILGGGTPLADGPVRDGRFQLAGWRALTPDTILLHYQREGRPFAPLPAIAP